MGDMRDRLTVLVLTYNRYPLLSRLLRYYQSCGSPFPMLILDSSSDAQGSEGLAGWLRAPGMTHVPYDPAISPTAKLDDGVRRVTTPYVLVWADDDLMVPRTMAEAVRFLEAHPDFSAAHGVSGVFDVGVGRGRQVHAGVAPYAQQSYLDETASQRLPHYLKDYSTLFYSVQRRAALSANLRLYQATGLGGSDTAGPVHRSDWWVELVLACLAVIRGKVKRLDRLYMLRERHASTDSWKEAGEAGRRLDLLDWVTCSSFAGAYRAFHACLSESLADRDGISTTKAQEVVKRAFWLLYLFPELQRKWDARYVQRGTPAPLRALRDAARHVPALRRMWRAVRSRMPGQEFSLEALLRSSSPYHVDFMPIYRAVAEQDGSAQHEEGAASETWQVVG